MIYESLSALSRDDAAAELTSGVTDRVCVALVRLALHDEDRAFLEDVIAMHLVSADPGVRMVAATCAGHVARLFRALDTARLVPPIRRLHADAATAGRADDALEDIAMFVRDGA